MGQKVYHLITKLCCQDELYFVTTTDLQPGTELVRGIRERHFFDSLNFQTYFSQEDPTVEFWTSWTEAWSNQLRCGRCSVTFESVADYRVHITIWHDTSFSGNPQVCSAQ